MTIKKRLLACMLAVTVLLGVIPIRAEAAFDAAYLASHPYAIWVNRVSSCVTVMGQDGDGNYSVPVKSFACSCGRNLADTPTGVFQTSEYYVWRKLYGNTYGRYAIRFNGSILFHSTPYRSRSIDSLITTAYNNLGNPASAGCVRLSVTDEKWLFDNTVAGTTVVVYDDATNPGPLGKPATCKINVNSPYATYDPSDVGFTNLGAAPNTLYLKKDYEDGILHMYRFAKEDGMKNIIGMYDGSGKELGAWEYKLSCVGNYDTTTPGVYHVSVTCTANSGASASANYTMIVE